MFPFGYNPYGSSYQSYDPYEQILLQQELQRRRQAEEYARRRQIEELNRRRAAQLEYARREAELQRRREAEAARQRQLELEARRRKLSEPARPRVRVGGPGSRHSMFDGGIQDLFDALYGHPRPRSPSPSAAGRRSASSAPKAERVRSPSAEPKSRVRFAPDDQSAVSDSEDQAVDGEASKGIPITVTTADETMDTTPDQVDSSPSRKAVDEILSKFAKLKSEFTFPSKLDFLPSSEGASTPTPKLAYTPNNAPLHQYEHLLTGLLTQLDAVESYGDAEVRKARKDAVKEIEKELEELDVKKVQDWRSQFEPPVVVEPTPKPAPDGEKVEEVSSNTEVAPDAQTPAQAQASFDPASVPLPQGEDRDLHMDIISEPNPTVSEPIATDTTPAQPVSGVEDAEAHLPQPAAGTQSSEDVHPASAMPRPSSPVRDPHADRTIISGQETPVKPAQETPTATVPASEAEHDTTEEDYVNITSEAKSAHGEDDDGKIKDDWQLEF